MPSKDAMYDLLIEHATIVDGTGAPAQSGALAVTDGRIAAVGSIDTSLVGPRTERIDATALMVCPGFIDPHTHYDAQLFWDPLASPSNVHGVTTIVAGNCGFTLAPLAEGDADYLRRMMAKVEGMPLAALEQGLDWQWSTFGEYLDRLDAGLGVDAAFMVGHCALRRRVMGPSAVGSEATAGQIDEMVALLHESLDAGGLGFSTTLARTHSDGDGQPVASRWASRDELLALARACGEHPGTQLEFASDGCLDGFDDDEVAFMIDFAAAADRPLNWNVLTVDSHDPERYRNQLAAMDRCAAAGVRVVALTMPILVGMNMSFGTYCALNMLPDWGPILSLVPVARLACLRDPDVRRFMAERAASPEAGVFSRLTGWDRYVIGDTYADPSLKGVMVGDLAAERGVDPFDALLDVVVADELRTVLWPGPTDDDDESWRLRAEAWEHPSVMIGGSDAGAHLDRMCGPPYTTQWLGDCLRGRRQISVERAVQHLTQRPAELFGFDDRGEIAIGKRADLVIFDPATIDSGPIELRHDLPGGTGRLVAPALGVSRVIVAGETTVVEGEPTGALPGRTLRRS
jgi:N-acyl-D-aspartate/D-glutamate deacylase